MKDRSRWSFFLFLSFFRNNFHSSGRKGNFHVADATSSFPRSTSLMPNIPPLPRCGWANHGFSLCCSRIFSPFDILTETDQRQEVCMVFVLSIQLHPLTADEVALTSESCINSRRTSSYNHTDRSLIEIKHKRRPVSQCEKCCELGKTRQVHSKCLCNEVMAEDRTKQGLALLSSSASKRELSPTKCERLR